MSNNPENTDDSLDTIPSPKGLVDIAPEYDVTDRTINVALYESDGSLDSKGYYDPVKRRVVGLVDNPRAVVKHSAIDTYVKDADGDGIRDLKSVLKSQILNGFNYPSVNLLTQFPLGAGNV